MVNNKDKEDKLPICMECGEEYNPEIEMFAKYHKGNICQHCSRERYEDEIGYEYN